MVTKYSDFIHLQNFLPVYDILEEGPSTWQRFIPTEQFNDLLRRSLTGITSKEVSKRKSIWVTGTFGTGKSHASAVIKHLLCDDLDNVSNYIDNFIKDPALKNQLKAIRQNKRYFAVTMKGVEGTYDIPRFSLTIQKSLTEALRKINPDFVVKSDFLAAKTWIETHRNIFDTAVLPNSDELNNYFDTTEQVIAALDGSNPSLQVFLSVEKAVRKHVGAVFEQTSISEWLADVEKEIEKQGIADGLIIFWDEFTSVMDTLKSDRINVLQNIAEKSQNNNIFLFLISHRLEAQSADAKAKEITKMSDRFDEIEYKMDSLSTYLIMRHSFTIPSGHADQLYKAMQSQVVPQLNDVLDFLTDGNKEQINHIKGLIPMHPYTAFLCSELSNFIGSSNRSVIKFMHDEESGFDAFLKSDTTYDTDMLLTADSLWDFFLPDFQKDPACTTFTSLYHNFLSKVQAQGDDYVRVFKSILLLNALSPKFQKSIELMTPNDKVLALMYAGDRIHYKITDILNYLNDNQIVSRDIFDEFKIRGTLYNQTEFNSERNKQRSSYPNAEVILNFDLGSKEEILDLFKVPDSLHRETAARFFSVEDTDQLIRSKLNKFTGDKPNYMHVAIFLSIEEWRRDERTEFLKNLSYEYPNLIIVLPDESFSKKYYDSFIDSCANKQLATTHFNIAEAKEYDNVAHGFVKKWITQLKNNTYNLFFNGKTYNESIIDQIPGVINDKLSARCYPKGFETMKFPKGASVSYTFYQDKNCPTIIEKVLQAQSREQLTQFSGNAAPLHYLFEDGANTLLTPNGNLSELAQNGDSWLVTICRHMDECLEKARKEYNDKFSLSEVLASFIHPPYGMFTSFLNCAAVAYSLRKHKDDLFVPAISQPVSDQALTDMIVELFKMWKDGKTEYSKKLLLRFGSPEESQTVTLLTGIFDLQKLLKVKPSEIKSLSNAKWYIQDLCKKVTGQPLWTLLYFPNLTENLRKPLNTLIELMNIENPSVEKIKKAYKELKLNYMELNLLVSDPSNYEKGFNAFVESIDGATIKKEWWNEMLAVIDQLPSEIAFRKESDVRETILKFYIGKITPKPDYLKSTVVSEPIVEPVKLPSQDLVLEAKGKIKSINMPNMLWQKTALDLLDEYPEVAEFFNRL